MGSSMADREAARVHLAKACGLKLKQNFEGDLQPSVAPLAKVDKCPTLGYSRIKINLKEIKGNIKDKSINQYLTTKKYQFQQMQCF